MSTPTIKDIRAAAAARRRRRQNIRRVFAGIGLVLVVGGGGLVWAAPSIIRGQLETRLGEFLQRTVTVERVRLNPFKMAMTVEGLRVDDHDGEVLVAWRRLMVNGDVWGTLTGSWAADAVELDGLRGRLAIDENGRLNVADIWEALPESADEAEARPLDVDVLVVSNARLKMTDASRSRPFATELGPWSFSLEGFHTKYDPEAPYQFEARTESGETLAWNGTLSLSPVHSEGAFEVRGLSLPKYAAYFDAWVPFEVEAGAVHAKGEYALHWTEAVPDLRLWHGEVVVDNLTLGAVDGHQGRKTVTEIDVLGLEVDLAARRLVAGEIRLSDGMINLRRTVDGIDWMGWVFAAATPEGPTVKTRLEEWSEVRVDRVVAERLVYRLEDQTLAEPTELGIEMQSVVVENLVVTDLASPVTLHFEATLPLGGELAVTGETKLEPLEPSLEVTASAVGLVMLRAHLQELAGIDLVRGELAMAGQIQSRDEGLVLLGDATVSDFWLLDGRGENLGGFGRLDLTDMELASAPLAAKVAKVVLTRPEGLVRVAADGRINLLELMPSGTTTVAATAPEALPDLKIGNIEIVAGRMDFRDESLATPATLSVDHVSGTLGGWSSDEVARAAIALRGKINATAPFTVAGDLNPLGRPAHADLTIEVDRMDLLPTGGYVGKYAGYDLARGTLTLDIDFHLRERAIESETMTLLDQFTLGAKTNSPDATKLPVPLGIALLKDKQGEIVIDVPVAGNLDDPEFRIGRVVWRVIGNLLTKVATSPFALLGAAVDGGEGVELEHHAFKAGMTRVTEETREGLDTVLAGLRERPQLSIGIRGEYDPAADAEAMRPAALEMVLRKRSAAASFGPEGDWAPFAREAALVSYYETVFGEPPMDPAGTLPVPAVDVAPAATEPAATVSTEEGRRSFIAWLGDVLTSGSPSASGTAESSRPEEPGGAFPVPDGLPVELPALSPEEITRRLLPEVTVDESMLTALARQRARTVKDYLIKSGLIAERLTILDPAAGSAQVTLDLR